MSRHYAINDHPVTAAEYGEFVSERLEGWLAEAEQRGARRVVEAVEASGLCVSPGCSCNSAQIAALARAAAQGDSQRW